MAPGKIKLLYICGVGRSGTTLFGRLLGQVSGFVNVGEAIRYLWNARMVSRMPACGCGAAVVACPFWRDLVDGIDEVDRAFATHELRLRNALRLLADGSELARSPEAARLKRSVNRVLVDVAARCGSEVIVDSSKHPTNAMLLTELPDVELHIVHLVRDPRAVVDSWSRPKGYLRAHSSLRIVAVWDVWNLLSERLRSRAASYTLLRYETAVSDAERTLRSVLSKLGRADAALPFIHGSEAQLRPDHSLAGNPDRFRTGSVRIAARPWSLSKGRAALVSLMALPLLPRYGYPSWAASG